MSESAPEPQPSQTPILDMSTPLPKPARRPFRTVLLAVEIAFLPLIIAATQAPAERYSLFTVPLFLLTAVVLAVAVHEFGHVFAGWIVGFQCAEIGIGPVSFDLRMRSLQVRSNQGMPIGGFAVMKIDRIRRLRRRFTVVSAGGPTANLLSVAAVPLLIKFIFPGFEKSWAVNLAVFFVVISLILSLVNFLPLRRRGLYTDGGRIEMLLASPQETRRWLAIHGLLQQLRQGVAAKNWNGHWAKTAVSFRDRSTDELTGNWLAYARASSRNDAAEAALFLERCLELVALAGLGGRDFLVQEAAISPLGSVTIGRKRRLGTIACSGRRGFRI